MAASVDESLQARGISFKMNIPAPILLHKRVTLVGSPPKPVIFFWTQRNPSFWSSRPLLGLKPASFKADEARKPNGPRR